MKTFNIDDLVSFYIDRKWHLGYVIEKTNANNYYINTGPRNFWVAGDMLTLESEPGQLKQS